MLKLCRAPRGRGPEGAQPRHPARVAEEEDEERGEEPGRRVQGEAADAAGGQGLRQQQREQRHLS